MCKFKCNDRLKKLIKGNCIYPRLDDRARRGVYVCDSCFIYNTTTKPIDIVQFYDLLALNSSRLN